MEGRRAAEEKTGAAERPTDRKPLPSRNAVASFSNMETQQLTRGTGSTAAPQRKIGLRDSPDEREAKAAEREAGSSRSLIPSHVRLTRPGPGFPHPLQLGARAYGMQNNIVLDPAIAVDSEEGQRIVAHELVHVEQAQRTGDSVIRPYIADDMVGTSIGAEYAQRRAYGIPIKFVRYR